MEQIYEQAVNSTADIKSTIAAPPAASATESDDQSITNSNGEEPTLSSDSDAQPSPLNATLLGSDRSLTSVAEILLCPTDWVTEAMTHPMLQDAITYLDRLSPLARQTPWLITSMSKDLNDADRSDSTDHASGKAMDIAPMYTDGIILPSEPPMLGLAWNIKSLILLSEGQWGDMPMFVEGDHLHFSQTILPDETGCLPMFWSDSDAYPAMAAQQYDPILSRLRNSFWRWSTKGLQLQSPSAELQKLIARLLGKTSS